MGQTQKTGLLAVLVEINFAEDMGHGCSRVFLVVYLATHRKKEGRNTLWRSSRSIRGPDRSGQYLFDYFLL